MTQAESFQSSFRLREWLVQPDLNRISGADGPVQVEPRVLQVLLALAARPGEVLSRGELLDQVWGDAVVGEEILTRAVSELRRVFGDDARQPRYIETIRQNGYRLIAPVEADSAAGPAAAAPPPPVEPAPPAPATPLPSPETMAADPEEAAPGRRRTRPRPGLLVVIAVAGALVVAAAAWYALRISGPVAPAPGPVSAIPLTSFAGREYHPAVSADGTRVAFAWSGPTGTATAIHVKQGNSEVALQVSHLPGWAAWPAWSPDGQSIAFVQTADTATAICVVPSLGGGVRRLHTVGHPIEGLDWSPGGEKLVFSARETSSGEYRLFSLELGDRSVSALPVTRADRAGDFQPRLDPAGRRVAWIGHSRSGRIGLYVADLDGADLRVVVLGQENLQGLAWRPDGRHLVYGAATAGVFGLWEVAVAGGASSRLAVPGDFVWNPAIARQSGDLVYEQVRVDQDLWQVRLLDRGSWSTESAALLPSTRWEYEADFSPDGASVALISARSGNPEIWLATAAGERLQKLTALGATALGNLRWAPDGALLACNAVIDGQHRILVTDPATGDSQRVTSGLAAEIFGAWSSATGSLLAGADNGRGWQIYRLSLAGAPPVPLTQSGGLIAQEDAAGRNLYFTRPGRPGLWRRQYRGRMEPELLLPDLLPRDRFNWRLLDDRIIWVTRAGSTALLMEYDLATNKAQLLTDLPGLQGSGLSARAGQDTYLYPRTSESAGDLMFVKSIN